jgi:hypothetical protein
VPLAAAAPAILVAGISGALVTGDGGARASIVARAPAAAAPAPAPAATTTEDEAPAAGSSDDGGDDASATADAAPEETAVAEAPVEELPVEEEPLEDTGTDDEDTDVPEDDPVIVPHVWTLAVQGPRAQEAVDRVAERGVTLTALKPVSPSVADSASALVTGLRPAVPGADPAAAPDPATLAPTLPEALVAAEQTWRTYVDVQPNDTAALPGTCAEGAGDPAAALLAARSPFRAIATLQEDGACAKAVRSLESLGNDVSSGEDLPSWSYVSLGGCAPPDRSVVALPDQVDDTVTAITESTEFQENGLVIVTSVGADDPCPVPGAPATTATPAPEAAPTVVLAPGATAGKKLDTPGDVLALPRLVSTTLGVSPPGVSGEEDVPVLELPGVEPPAATD